ncbi:MAG TPA: hypothetical protein VIQ05_24180 [Tardiphaga sp.]
MTIDTWLGLFGTISGLVGLFLAYYFYKKSIRTKVLAISYTDPIPLMMTMGDVEVIYEGAVVRALSTIYILFWNRGTVAIEGSDFLAPVVITSSKSLLNLQIHDKDAAVAATLDDKNSSISIGLLRPGEAITLVAEVASEMYLPEISVQMKSADMSTLISGFHSLYPDLAALAIGVLLFVTELTFMYSSINSESNFDPNQSAIMTGLMAMFSLAVGLLFFGVIPVGAGFLTRRLTKAFLSRTITPVAWKFFQFKVSAFAMRFRLKEFRKIIDAEYKKIAPN